MAGSTAPKRAPPAPLDSLQRLGPSAAAPKQEATVVAAEASPSAAAAPMDEAEDEWDAGALTQPYDAAPSAPASPARAPEEAEAPSVAASPPRAPAEGFAAAAEGASSGVLAAPPRAAADEDAAPAEDDAAPEEPAAPADDAPAPPDATAPADATAAPEEAPAAESAAAPADGAAARRFAVGDVVRVAARFGANENKPGGVARVTRAATEAGRLVVDVSYVLGGRERRLDAEALVEPYALGDDRAKRTVFGRCKVFGCGSLAVDCGAGKERDMPNFKGSDLGRVPLVSADFWTNDHLSERSRRVDACSGTRARGTLTLKRP